MYLLLTGTTRSRNAEARSSLTNRTVNTAAASRSGSAAAGEGAVDGTGEGAGDTAMCVVGLDSLVSCHLGSFSG